VEDRGFPCDQKFPNAWVDAKAMRGNLLFTQISARNPLFPQESLFPEISWLSLCPTGTLAVPVPALTNTVRTGVPYPPKKEDRETEG
jgi:hypothetical protein